MKKLIVILLILALACTKNKDVEIPAPTVTALTTEPATEWMNYFKRSGTLEWVAGDIATIFR